MTDTDSDAPEEQAIVDERQQAGQDKSIARRLEKNPESSEARLDNALDESMDASDPPASPQPRVIVAGKPPPVAVSYRRTRFVASDVAAQQLS